MARTWRELGRLREREAQLAARDEAARHSPEWLELAMTAGQHVQFRPTVHEAVAPYVPPATPETRDPTAAEARARLEQDWLHQAGGGPTVDRIRQEIRWTRELIDRLASAPGNLDLAKDRAALDAHERVRPRPLPHRRERALLHFRE